MLKIIYNWLTEYFSKDAVKLYTQKKEELEKKQFELSVLSAEITNIKENLNNSKQLLIDLEEQNDSIMDLLEYQLPIPKPIKELINYYDTKYPMKHLTYKGMPIKLKNTANTPDVYVCDFIYAFESLKSYLKDKNLTFPDYYATYKDYALAMDKLREDIYLEVLRMRRYRYDSELFGSNEFWSGPFISFYLKINNTRYMDCEDSSLLLMSLYLAAGIPRGLQRVICGMTSLGGHAAVGVYSFTQKQWLHYETTALTRQIYNLDDAETNPLCITDTWFSFDWKYSWSINPKLIGDFIAKKSE